MKLSILCLILQVFSFSATGQVTVSSPDPRTAEIVKQRGQIFSIELVPGKPLRLYVVGREEAQLDLTQMELRVRRLKPYPGKVLTTDRMSDHFVISESVDLQKPLDLEVTPRLKNKSETILLHLEHNRP